MTIVPTNPSVGSLPVQPSETDQLMTTLKYSIEKGPKMAPVEKNAYHQTLEEDTVFRSDVVKMLIATINSKTDNDDVKNRAQDYLMELPTNVVKVLISTTNSAQPGLDQETLKTVIEIMNVWIKKTIEDAFRDKTELNPQEIENITNWIRENGVLANTVINLLSDYCSDKEEKNKKLSDYCSDKEEKNKKLAVYYLTEFLVLVKPLLNDATLKKASAIQEVKWNLRTFLEPKTQKAATQIQSNNLKPPASRTQQTPTPSRRKFTRFFKVPSWIKPLLHRIKNIVRRKTL